MGISILIVDGARLAIDEDAEEVKKAIADALRDGGGFVRITTTDGRHTDVLFTSGTRAKIEYPAERETNEAGEGAGASLPESFLPEDFTSDYGL